jgi:hypothetical protein
MRKFISTFMLGAIVMLLISGCSKKAEDLVPSNSSATDSQTAMSIFSNFSSILSQIQFTKSNGPAGNINQTINGPNGGSVAITGTGGYDQATQKANWDISMNWSAYKWVSGNDSYTYNGQMTFSGSASSAGAGTFHFGASNFTMKGTYNGSSVDQIFSCAFDVTFTSDGHGNMTGNVDGRSFSYTF